MRKRVSLCVLALVLAVWVSVRGQSQPPTEFILRARADLVDDIIQRHRLTLVETLDDTEELSLVRGPVGIDDDDLEDEVDDDSEVDEFERNQAVQVPETPGGGRLNESTAAILETLPDPTPIFYHGTPVWRGYVQQPAAVALQVEAAHGFASGTHVVAVIDTGVDPDHVMLRSVLTPGFDFTRDAAGPASEWNDLSASTAAILEQHPPGSLRSVTINESTAAILEESTAAILEGPGVDVPTSFGHGTMVAGLIHLVAPTARIMPLKAFRADGTATLADILRAIYFAADNGARVINMSFSVREASDELMRALSYAAERGVVSVASAGNTGSEVLVFPAGFRHALGVGSTNNVGERSVFSNHGRGAVRMWLPGESLITSYPGGHYAAAWGTSFSAALASGAAALLTQVNPEIVQERADELLAHGQSDLPRALQALVDDRGNLAVPPSPPLAPRPPSIASTFLVLDADAVRAGTAPLFLTSAEVNESVADFAARSPLSGFQARLGTIVTLPGGQVGNEGWFAVKSAPTAWRSAGPTFDGTRNFAGEPSMAFPHRVGPGLGTPDAGGNRESLLDKVPGVTPLRATGLRMLEGASVCAVVQKGDVSMNYGPVTGSLKGAKLGTVAFRVLSVRAAVGSSSGQLPDVRVQVLNPVDACQSLTLMAAAPLPGSSSQPFDTVP